MINLHTFFHQRVIPFFFSKTAQSLLSLLAVAFTGLVFGLFIWRERNILLNHKWVIDFQALIQAFFIYTLALFLGSFLWTKIIQTLGVRVSFWNHFRNFSISMLAKRLPGTVWYVAYRNQMYQREGLSVSLTTLASGIEYALLMVSSILVAFLFAVPFARKNTTQLWLVILVLILFVSFLHPRVLGWILRKLGKVDHKFAYQHILVWLFSYILLRLLSGLLVFSIVRIIYPVSYDNIWYIIGGWSMASVITNLLLFSPSNLGLTEVTLSFVLSSLMPSSIAVIAAVLTRIATMSFELLWALASLLISQALQRIYKPSPD